MGVVMSAGWTTSQVLLHLMIIGWQLAMWGHVGRA
jgi:hypothetical protein